MFSLLETPIEIRNTPWFIEQSSFKSFKISHSSGYVILRTYSNGQRKTYTKYVGNILNFGAYFYELDGYLHVHVYDESPSTPPPPGEFLNVVARFSHKFSD